MFLSSDEVSERQQKARNVSEEVYKLVKLGGRKEPRSRRVQENERDRDRHLAIAGPLFFSLKSRFFPFSFSFLSVLQTSCGYFLPHKFPNNIYRRVIFL